MEIPNRVEFDFLLVLLGLGFIISPTYIDAISLEKNISIIVFFTGLLMFSLGLYFLYHKYKMDYELKRYEFLKQKHEYINDFHHKELIDQERKEELIDKIKKTLSKT